MRNKTAVGAFILCILIIPFLITPAYALFDTDVDKAKDFMKADMYPQAIDLLNKRINEKPTDGEAHYQLGLCYLKTGDYGSADTRFNSAVKLDADYNDKVAVEFKNEGIALLDKSQVGQAIFLLEKAVGYKPEFKNDIAMKCFDAGKKYLNSGQTAGANDLLSIAGSYNPALQKDIDAIKKEYGNKLLTIAKDKPKNERKKYIDEAKLFLTQEDIDAVFPPPSWQTVLGPVEYTGKGLEKKDAYKVAEFGKDYLSGDKAIVRGNSFEVYNQGWKQYTGYNETINKSNETGKFFGVRAPKGEKFTVEIQRYIENY